MVGSLSRRIALAAASVLLSAAPTISGAVLVLAPVTAEAHPGALDANGCHRVRKTGRKVCHAGHIKPGEHRRFVGFDGVVRHYSH